MDLPTHPPSCSLLALRQDCRVNNYEAGLRGCEAPKPGADHDTHLPDQRSCGKACLSTASCFATRQIVSRYDCFETIEHRHLLSSCSTSVARLPSNFLHAYLWYMIIAVRWVSQVNKRQAEGVRKRAEDPRKSCQKWMVRVLFDLVVLVSGCSSSSRWQTSGTERHPAHNCLCLLLHGLVTRCARCFILHPIRI